MHNLQLSYNESLYDIGRHKQNGLIFLEGKKGACPVIMTSFPPNWFMHEKNN